MYDSDFTKRFDPVLRLAICLFGFAVLASSATAQTPSYCFNSSKAGPDQTIDGRSMGLPYEIIRHALAEKFCKAKPKPMGPLILGYILEQGCDPTSEVYRDIASSISKVEQADLRTLAADGEEPNPLTQLQAEQWAENAVAQFGGCKALVKYHDESRP